MGNRPTTHLTFTLIHHKSQAEQLLAQAEQKDFYLTECHDDRSNSYARRQMTYAPNTISPIDVRFYTLQLDVLKDRVPVRLQHDLGPISIISLMPTADGGMPHTRPDAIICYPDIQQVTSLTTLVHELWHIHQRKFQRLWSDVFRRLGWTEWQGRLPLSLENHRRYNPDTIDSPLWAFKGVWVPVPVFHDVSRPAVADVSIWFYHTESRQHVKEVPLELAAVFPQLPAAAYEHPRELTAYMLSSSAASRGFSPGYRQLVEILGHASEMDAEEGMNNQSL